MANLSYATSKLSSLLPLLQVTTFLSWSTASASARKNLFCKAKLTSTSARSCLMTHYQIAADS